jgi:hypothetical protein
LKPETRQKPERNAHEEQADRDQNRMLSERIYNQVDASIDATKPLNNPSIRTIVT